MLPRNERVNATIAFQLLNTDVDYIQKQITTNISVSIQVILRKKKKYIISAICTDILLFQIQIIMHLWSLPTNITYILEVVKHILFILHESCMPVHCRT